MRTAAVITTLALAVVVVLAAAAGCGSAGAPAGEPRDVVERFYAAIADGDCAAATAQLAGAYRAELEREGTSCAALIEELRPLALEAVVSATVDGRDPGAHLVRVRLSGRRVDVVIRVKAEGGRWKIFAM